MRFSCQSATSLFGGPENNRAETRTLVSKTTRGALVPSDGVLDVLFGQSQSRDLLPASYKSRIAEGRDLHRLQDDLPLPDIRFKIFHAVELLHDLLGKRDLIFIGSFAEHFGLSNTGY
jgi:hypothetical protein